MYVRFLELAEHFLYLSIRLHRISAICLELDKHRRILAPGDRLCGTAIWPGPLLAKLFGRDFLDHSFSLLSLTD